MTGLDRILEKIQSDCDARCAEIVAAGDKQCAEIMENGQREAEKVAALVIEDANSKSVIINQHAESAQRQIIRRAELAAKNAAVDEVIDKVHKQLDSLADLQYFDALTALLMKNAADGEGIMYLSERDMKRCPRSFVANANAQLGAGRSIKLGGTSSIKNGFVLVYGDIEINCAFDSLLDDMRDEIKERICSIIF